MTCNSECRRPTGRMCHCGACHKTFVGITVFDEHRRGGQCVMNPDWTEKNEVWGNWGSNNNAWWAK